MDKKRRKERRRHPRIKTSFGARLKGYEGILPTFHSDVEVINLSCSGAYLKIQHQVELFTKAEVRMFLPIKEGGKTTECEMNIEGVVVRVSPEDDQEHTGEYQVAIFFPSLNRIEKHYIEEYIKQNT